MTVIRPNSISGVTSITAQTNALNFYDSAGTTLSIGASVTGNITGDVTGNLTGNVTGDVNAGVITATTITGVSTIGVTTVTATNLTVNGNAYPTAGPLSNRNLIINGAMAVAQRGTSSTSGGYQTIDRYSTDDSSGTTTKTQESLSSGDPYDMGFRNFLRLTNTSIVSDTSAGYRNIYQGIEAQNVAQSGWNYTSSSSYITLSFWVRSSVSQEYFGSIQTFDGTQQKYPFSTGTLAANTWTKIIKIIPGNTNVTVNNDNGAGILINISPFWGTNYTDSGVSVDTWASFSGSTRFPDFTSTWATTAGATFDITGVQLEVGEVATPFEHRSYGDELLRCQRYCQRYTKIAASGTVASSTATYHPFTFLTEFRSAPALTVNTLGNTVKEGTNWYPNTAISLNDPCPSGTNLNCTQSNNGMVAVDSTRLGNGCDLTFTAEL